MAHRLLDKTTILPQQRQALLAGDIPTIIILLGPVVVVLILFFANRYVFHRIIKTIHDSAFEKVNDAIEKEMSKLPKINIPLTQVLLSLHDRMNKSREEYVVSVRNTFPMMLNVIFSLIPLIWTILSL